MEEVVKAKDLGLLKTVPTDIDKILIKLASALHPLQYKSVYRDFVSVRATIQNLIRLEENNNGH